MHAAGQPYKCCGRLWLSCPGSSETSEEIGDPSQRHLLYLTTTFHKLDQCSGLIRTKSGSSHGVGMLRARTQHLSIRLGALAFLSCLCGNEQTDQQNKTRSIFLSYLRGSELEDARFVMRRNFLVDDNYPGRSASISLSVKDATVFK